MTAKETSHPRGRHHRGILGRSRSRTRPTRFPPPDGSSTASTEYARPILSPWGRDPEHFDTVVIGGGQAGLAMSAVLQQRGIEHVVLERRQEATLADRALGVAALPVPELVTRTAGLLRRLGRGCERLRALARYPARHRVLRGEHACSGARAHRGNRAACGRRRIRAGRPGRDDPRSSCCRRHGAVRAATHPAVRRGRCAVGATDRSDALPATGGPSGRRRAVVGSEHPAADRRRTAACWSYESSYQFPASARTAAVPWQDVLVRTGWAASLRRSTVFPGGSGLRRPSSPA